MAANMLWYLKRFCYSDCKINFTEKLVKSLGEIHRLNFFIIFVPLFLCGGKTHIYIFYQNLFEQLSYIYFFNTF